ncbi:response regulator [Paraburkholderia sp. SIMBA_055]
MKVILLVDDEELPQDALQALLESESYRVVCAANGADALARLSASRVDLVVTDWAMPVMDGLQFCQRMRSDALLHAIPILLVSSKAAPQWDGTWDVFMRKPFAPQHLLQTIQTLTAQAGSRARPDTIGPRGSVVPAPLELTSFLSRAVAATLLLDQ